jgi:hypothetical protein
MDRRRSIDVDGVRHPNPIACRRGPFLLTGAISGADPASGVVSDGLDEQCRQMFANVRRALVDGGRGTS